jgi:NADH-quinone oxidoreductase subunit N
MLIGLAAAPRLAAAGPDAPALVGGVEAILFYLAAYGAMTVGAFAILHLLSAQGREAETVDDLAGLGRSHPGLALVLTLFLLSMIGIPLTAGFFGKLQLFSLAVSLAAGSSSALAQPDPQVAEQARLYGLLALIAAINAVIAAWYYLRVASAMYLREGIEPLPRVRPSPAWGAVALCAVVTVVLGVWPAPLQKALRGAVEPPARVAAP